MSNLKKWLPILVPGITWGIVIWKLSPPSSLIEANSAQLILFFAPLFLLLVSIMNLYFNFYLKSIVVGLGIIILLVLQALGILNIVSFILTLIAVLLILKTLKKTTPKRRFGAPKLTPQVKIPKLSHLEKQK